MSRGNKAKAQAALRAIYAETSGIDTMVERHADALSDEFGPPCELPEWRADFLENVCYVQRNIYKSLLELRSIIDAMPEEDVADPEMMKEE